MATSSTSNILGYVYTNTNITIKFAVFDKTKLNEMI